MGDGEPHSLRVQRAAESLGLLSPPYLPPGTERNASPHHNVKMRLSTVGPALIGWPAKDKDMHKMFAVFYKPGRTWRPGKPVSEQRLKEHVDYLLGIHERGELIMGGPFSDSSGALVLLEVDGIDRARGLISEDPAIIKEVLTAEVYQWDRVV